jgi:hypothetical protein
MPIRKKDITYLNSLLRRNEPNRSHINQVVDLYESRQIPRLDTAELLIDQLQSRGKAKNKKAIERIADYATNETRDDRLIRTAVENNVVKDVQYLHDESARPVVKILLNVGIDLIPKHFQKAIKENGKVDYTILHEKLYDIVSSASKKTIDNEIVKQQQKYKNIKEMIGLNLDIYKVVVFDTDNYTGDDPFVREPPRKMTNEEVRKMLMKEGYRLYYNPIQKLKQIIVVRNEHYSSKNRTIVNKNTSSQSKEQLEDLKEHVSNLGNVEGSDWRLLKFCYFYITIFKTNPVRGSSYIPTPEPYNDAKCGLINIQNQDQECFRWCAKYHQSKKDKHDDRITVLRKLDDKYDYSNMQYPSSHEDISIFEENNKVCVFVYFIDEDNSIREEYRGDVNYLTNDIIYLLRIEQEDQSHCVYIKHIQRLLHLNHSSKVKRKSMT